MYKNTIIKVVKMLHSEKGIMYSVLKQESQRCEAAYGFQSVGGLKGNPSRVFKLE
jgi:hypothetical protein